MPKERKQANRCGMAKGVKEAAAPVGYLHSADVEQPKMVVVRGWCVYMRERRGRQAGRRSGGCPGD